MKFAIKKMQNRKVQTKASKVGYRARKPLSNAEIIKREVAKELNKKVDKKCFILAVSSTSIDFSGTVFLLTSTMTRGDGVSQYEGTSIVPKHLRIRWRLNSTLNNSCVRIIVLQWFDAATPVALGILATTGSADDFLAPTRVENKPLMRILSDSMYALNPVYSNVTASTVGEIYVPAYRLQKMTFKSGTDAPQNGALYLLAISDDGVTDYPDINFYSELCFTDM